jgi:hypothetical protein
MAPSGIEPATFRLVSQFLNQLRHQQRVVWGDGRQNSATVLIRPGILNVQLSILITQKNKLTETEISWRSYCLYNGQALR